MSGIGMVHSDMGGDSLWRESEHRCAPFTPIRLGENISNPYEQNRQVDLLSESERHMFERVQPCGQEVNC